MITPVELGALIAGRATPGADALDSVLGPGERFAMLLERIDELSLAAPRLRRAARTRCWPGSCGGSTGSRRI